MNKIVDISGERCAIAPLDIEAVKSMMAADTLPFDGRVELIDGVLIEMTPANYGHAASHGRLTTALARALSGGLEVLIDPALFLAENLMLGPDIVVLPRGVVSHDAAGADVALAVEIAHSTLPRDLGLKAERYARHAVREYWVVDLENRQLHIHRDPTADGYASIVAQSWDAPATPLCAPEAALVLADILAD